jgi:hypothetical protein
VKKEDQAEVRDDENDQSGDKVLKDEQPMTVGRVGDIDDIGDAEEDSDDDQKDDDFNGEDEEDEKDEEFVVDTKKKAAKTSKKGPTAKRVSKKQKVAPAKKEIAKKHKVALSAEDQLKKDTKKHQKEFSICENKHLDTVEEWKAAIQAKDVDNVAKILGILLDEVGTFPASFIEGYELSPLMKASKALLKETETKDLDSYHEVWKRMKTAHGEGKKTMPDKFRPTKRKPAKTLATKNEDPKDKMVPVTVSREKTLVSASRKEKLIDTQDPPSSQEGPSIPIPRRGVTIMDDMSSRSDTKAANPGRIPPKPERKSFTLGSLMRSNPKDGEKPDASVSAHSSGKATR